ncbi:aminomethyl-transferring glycine dehydrogenase subunit GcvPA [Ahrensia sp. AH-315-G08]|nr:aminomethyl-transferring glycine dehydrogenase subunit GcvPA [Ahrensia sp. AH-315-G08]
MSTNTFLARHVGPNDADKRHMLNTVGVTSLEALIAQTIPDNIRMTDELSIPDGVSEEVALAELRAIMEKNVVAKSMIGQGYHGTHVPPVIQRNMFENPAWYTAYTPYQPEISQGRLEMLFHFQTLVSELTGLPVANASLLDEATAVAEAVGIALRHHRGKRTRVVVANDLHPQTLSVLKTRGKSMGFDVVRGAANESTCAVILQMPDTFGSLIDPATIVKLAQTTAALVIVVADPLSLVKLKAPGDWGADICVGSLQRFGVPLGNGGPHAAFMAISEPLTRLMPGRIIGQSLDAHGRPAYRLALQTREQHIRREKATSNICTAQALLANMAAAYAIWHGPEGLREIANRVHGLAQGFADAAVNSELEVINSDVFDTVTLKLPGQAKNIVDAAMAEGLLLRLIDENTVSVAFDETTGAEELQILSRVFDLDEISSVIKTLPLERDASQFMTQAVFHSCSSETEMMRYLRVLADKDLALDRAMIPLGSCTMKLNAADLNDK